MDVQNVEVACSTPNLSEKRRRFILEKIIPTLLARIPKLAAAGHLPKEKDSLGKLLSSRVEDGYPKISRMEEELSEIAGTRVYSGEVYMILDHEGIEYAL